MRKKEAALESAKRIHENLLQLSNSPAFQKEHLAETLCLYHLLFKSGPDPQTGVSFLQEALDTYKHLGADSEVPLWHDAAPAVVGQITDIAKSKQVELLLLQLLSCITATQQCPALGRGEIDDFLDDMWQL
jgi:hypothetical protein